MTRLQRQKRDSAGAVGAGRQWEWLWVSELVAAKVDYWGATTTIGWKQTEWTRTKRDDNWNGAGRRDDDVQTGTVRSFRLVVQLVRSITNRDETGAKRYGMANG